jgi:hypothetical protein
MIGILITLKTMGSPTPFSRGIGDCTDEGREKNRRVEIWVRR